MKNNSDLEIEVLKEMGYNPKTETYTPWYGLTQKVDFESDKIIGSGEFSRKGIKIKKNISAKEKTRVFYHEKIHADLFPVGVLTKFFGLASILSLGMPQVLDNNSYLVGSLCLLSSLAYLKAISLLDESIAYTAEYKKFGIPENSNLTKEVLSRLKPYLRLNNQFTKEF